VHSNAVAQRVRAACAHIGVHGGGVRAWPHERSARAVPDVTQRYEHREHGRAALRQRLLIVRLRVLDARWGGAVHRLDRGAAIAHLARQLAEGGVIPELRRECGGHGRRSTDGEHRGASGMCQAQLDCVATGR